MVALYLYVTAAVNKYIDNRDICKIQAMQFHDKAVGFRLFRLDKRQMFVKLCKNARIMLVFEHIR